MDMRMLEDSTFAERLTERRKAARLTQKGLSVAVGVESNTIYKWEKGLIVPSIDSVRKVAMALSTNTSYLLGETDDPAPAQAREALVDMDEAVYPSEWIRVPIYDLRTCAGYGASHLFADIETIGEIILDADSIGAISPYDDKRPFVTQIVGDSMSDADLPDGSKVLINPAEEVHSGDAALVCFGNNLDTAIKWVYYLPDRVIELRSATPGFPVIRYTKEQQEDPENPLIIIGKVMVSIGTPKRGL